MTDAPNVSDTFHRPCLACGIAVETVGSVTRGHVCTPNEATVARAYWHGYDRAQTDLAGHLAAERERTRHDWADYISNWSGAVGPKPPTVEGIVAALRADHEPFGIARQEPTT